MGVVDSALTAEEMAVTAAKGCQAVVRAGEGCIWREPLATLRSGRRQHPHRRPETVTRYSECEACAAWGTVAVMSARAQG